ALMYSSSKPFTPRLSCGSTYVLTHTRENRRPAAPARIKRLRQPNWPTIQNSNGLMKARPKYWPTAYTLFARARSCCGNHELKTRLLAGKQGASATPSPNRQVMRLITPDTKPCSNVHADHNETERK